MTDPGYEGIIAPALSMRLDVSPCSSPRSIHAIELPPHLVARRVPRDWLPGRPDPGFGGHHRLRRWEQLFAELRVWLRYVRPQDANGALALTDNVNLERRSAFDTTRQDITRFEVHFQYQATPYAGAAGFGDGATFTIENDPTGAKAVGNSGSGLGYEGITSSVAVELNVFSVFNGAGTFLGINGTTGATQGGYLPTGVVSLLAGDPIGVDLFYNGTTLRETLTDLTTAASFQISYTVNIPAIVGGTTAYIGFTGGTGLATANQTIGNFAMVVPEPASLSLLTCIGLMIAGAAGARARLNRAWPGSLRRGS